MLLVLVISVIDEVVVFFCSDEVDGFGVVEIRPMVVWVWEVFGGPDVFCCGVLSELVISEVDVECTTGFDEVGPGCLVVPDEVEGLVVSDVTATVLSGELGCIVFAVDIDDAGIFVELGV